MRNSIKAFGMSLVAAGLLLSGCSSNNNAAVLTPAQAQSQTTFVQVEQLARPGINEATLVTNAFLNTYNAVSPSFIAAALANPTGPEGTAAGPVLTEASSNIRVFVSTNTTLSPDQVTQTVNALVGALLPDVMRIDTSLSIGVGQPSFAAAVNAKGSPVGGRKLTDDVIDVALTLLTAGAVTTDNVPYYRPAAGQPGANNSAIGHQLLNNQTTQNGPATFPFLAPAN